MRRLHILFLSVPCLLLAALTLAADEKPRISPHETVNAEIDGNGLTIVYGRPYTKDPKTGAPRKIWGELVPFGQVWRMGADEATLLTTKAKINLGGVSIPAGTYSLFLQPEADGTAKLIVNKQTGQWGTKYDQSQDLVRVDLKKEATPDAVDQFTIEVEKNEGGGGTLQMMWGDTQYSAAIKTEK